MFNFTDNGDRNEVLYAAAAHLAQDRYFATRPNGKGLELAIPFLIRESDLW